MHHERIVSLLSAFNKDDLKLLGSYLQSPYFNVSSSSVALFEYLVNLHPDFPEKRLEPPYVAQRVKALPTLGAQRSAGTRLLKAIEHFIALEDWQGNEMNVAWHRFHALQQLERLEEFSVEYQKIIEKIEADPEQDIDTFFNRHRFTDLSANSFDARLNRTSRNDILPTLKTLDEFYAVKLLRYLCEAVSRKQVLGTGYAETHLSTILTILEPYNNQKYPYVYLFVNVYHMLVAETYDAGKVYYSLIKNFIASQTSETLPQSCIESMTYAINWGLYWIGRGYEEPVPEYLWWTELKIKYNLLLESGKLLPITFRNIVTSAFFNNQQPEWMQKFIKQFSPYMPVEHREVNVAFAQGLYYYRVKDLTKATQYFMQAQVKEEVIFNALVKRWHYMCTYELNPEDTEFLYSQLRSFDRYIERNEEAFHQLKAGFSLFIQYAKDLTRTGSRKERAELKARLQQESFFPGKPWLLQKLD